MERKGFYTIIHTNILLAMTKFIDIKKKESWNGKKIRVNITVDKAALDRAKTKLNLFGGKLSTLFNVYLNDFVESMDKKGDENIKELNEEIKMLKERLEKIERSEKNK